MERFAPQNSGAVRTPQKADKLIFYCFDLRKNRPLRRESDTGNRRKSGLSDAITTTKAVLPGLPYLDQERNLVVP
jgi:hypothetical protein